MTPPVPDFLRAPLWGTGNGIAEGTALQSKDLPGCCRARYVARQAIEAMAILSRRSSAVVGVQSICQ